MNSKSKEGQNIGNLEAKMQVQGVLYLKLAAENGESAATIGN